MSIYRVLRLQRFFLFGARERVNSGMMSRKTSSSKGVFEQVRLNTSFQPTGKEKRKTDPLPCAVCGECAPTFIYCTACKLVVYCGRECQKRDWKTKTGGYRERCALLKENVTDVLMGQSEAYFLRE
uniref:MYND-type domain-containing protein n=1 Tax=Chromera velia CCMP2878 TaxID=1169474 RepID=A0A0G4FAK6_9ALVE|mmetsp:Transcript_50657/g.99651  ORF Transcript_50657/g.99651 Transcript_50657/m.99651 type:complete len:126 (-) Transcript_50657:159-536(-)|eukprot:Cvel_3027.t1-p1 / transcript=Cvel_3027.t1 / gene=Cvel_3027 / organism=Chromera_velia_CCMP2878 / gene_product=hypothetical protein / transcript_product=hypothetical protein / location=Cvel_scaffold121:28145-28519(-) / protein_length=125 / sequence_SO=supercontig / SO=protein_coding / is_pseudo=false